MNIHQLMEAFAKLGETHIGRGPKDPLSNNLELTKATEQYLALYPFLKRDQGYGDFLEFYSGAYLFQPTNGLAIDIFGFTQESSNINELESPTLDKDGYLAFCDVALPKKDSNELEGTGFAFDATGQRQNGIYRAVISNINDSTVMSFYWYCSNFLEWLEILINSNGHFPERV